MGPSWWRQFDSCRELFLPASPLFLYVSSPFINESPLTEALYRATRADHCVMVTMVFLKWAHPMGGNIKMCPVGHDPRMLEGVHKGVLYLLSDAVVCVVLESRVYDIVAKTRYSPELAHAAVVCSSEVDWSVGDCRGWYR